jgi:DNA-binding NarL/FixJ family response regulator
MAIRRVFIAWSHSLFYGSVRLLLNHPAIEIVGSGQDSETIWNEVINLRPDTVIVERTGEVGETAASHQAFRAWDSGTRIIRVGLENNIAQVCRCEQHTLEKAEDLLQLVLDQ